MADGEEASLFTLGEVRRVFPVPEDLDWALRQTAPQALLRDLHRPAQRFEVVLNDFERVDMIRADAGGDQTRERRGTLLASYRAPLDEFPWASRQMLEQFRAVREVLARPWKDAPKLGPATLTPEQERYLKGL